MALSTLRKYKLITNTDLMASVKSLQKTLADDKYDEYTSTAEPIYYGLNLARDMVDINEARKRFNEYKSSGDMGDYAETFSAGSLSTLITESM